MHSIEKIAGLHPFVVTGVTIAWFVVGGVSMTTVSLGSANWILIYSLTMALFTAPLLLWHYCIYRTASDRSAPFVGHAGRRGLSFLVCAVSLGCFLVVFSLSALATPGDPASRTMMIIGNISMPVGCIAYFVAVWATANALTRFDEKEKDVAIHKTLGTFFLQVYFPIGIWFTHPRIKRMVATPIPV